MSRPPSAEKLNNESNFFHYTSRAQSCIDLKIKKLDRVALPTPVAQDEEQAEANALLQEINQKATKQAVKEFVAIIK